MKDTVLVKREWADTLDDCATLGEAMALARETLRKDRNELVTIEARVPNDDGCDDPEGTTTALLSVSRRQGDAHLVVELAVNEERAFGGGFAMMNSGKWLELRAAKDGRVAATLKTPVWDDDDEDDDEYTRGLRPPDRWERARLGELRQDNWSLPNTWPRAFLAELAAAVKAKG